MRMTSIAKFTNAEYGIESQVVETVRGYSVILRDTDADQVLPMIAHIYQDLDQAIEKAQLLVAR